MDYPACYISSKRVALSKYQNDQFTKLQISLFFQHKTLCFDQFDFNSEFQLKFKYTSTSLELEISAICLHLSTLRVHLTISTRYLNSSARVSASLGLRQTNDFEIDSNNFTSHGQQRNATQSNLSQSLSQSNPGCSFSLTQAQHPKQWQRERASKRATVSFPLK